MKNAILIKKNTAYFYVQLLTTKNTYMKILNYLSFLLILILAGNVSAQDNTLTKKEQKEGWVLAFDGKTAAGWRGYNKPGFPEKGWDFAEGSLHALPNGGGGDVILEKKLSNFELVLDWKISEGGNSGIFIFGHELEGKPIYFSAPEMQVLDNDRHADAKAGKDGNHKSGSLYDMIPANPQNTKPAGEWNSVKIVANSGNIQLWQNGVQVVQFTMGTEEWKKMCANSKFKDWPEFVNNNAKDGLIGLQDHGNEVWFKNIKIKELK